MHTDVGFQHESKRKDFLPPAPALPIDWRVETSSRPGNARVSGRTSEEVEGMIQKSII